MADIELVIKISEENYEEYKRIGDSRDILFEAIRKGIVLPEHHGRLLILDEGLVERNLVSLNATTSFCNKWLSEVGISNSVVKIIPATENEFFNFDAPIIKKQTATKEDCALTDCKCNNNGKCTDGLAYKESCYDCYQPANCATCGQPRDYKGQCILFQEGKCANAHEKWKPATEEGDGK